MNPSFLSTQLLPGSFTGTPVQQLQFTQTQSYPLSPQTGSPQPYSTTTQSQLPGSLQQSPGTPQLNQLQLEKQLQQQLQQQLQPQAIAEQNDVLDMYLNL